MNWYRATTLLVCCIVGTSAVAGQARSRIAPPTAPSTLRLTSANEPGQALRITGTVVDGRGRPVPAASLYVYQTDARGFYSPDQGQAESTARIHGWLRSDRNGEFEFTTIRPGSYPNSRIPQHVHFVVNADGHAERVFEIVFDDDPFVDARVRSEAGKENSVFSICKPQRSGPLLHCSERIVLR